MSHEKAKIEPEKTIELAEPYVERGYRTIALAERELRARGMDVPATRLRALFKEAGEERAVPLKRSEENKRQDLYYPPDIVEIVYKKAERWYSTKQEIGSKHELAVKYVAQGWRTPSAIISGLTGPLGSVPDFKLVVRLCDKYDSGKEKKKLWDPQSGLGTYYPPEVVAQVKDELRSRSKEKRTN